MANDHGMHNKSVLETWSSTKQKETPHYAPTDLDKIAAMTPTFAHFCQWLTDFDPRYANHFSAGSLMQETGVRNLAISIEAASIYSAVPNKVQADHRKPALLHRLYSPFKLVHGARNQ